MLQYNSLTVGAFQVNCRFIFNPETKNCVICDPGDDADRIMAFVSSRGLNVTAVLLTHGHLDHCGAAATVAEHYKTGITGPSREDSMWLDILPRQAVMFGLPSCPPLTPDRWLTGGEKLDLGLGEEAEVLHCPGHTPGHVCFHFPLSGILLSGDVLFAGSVGRSDFPGGNHEDLISSIRNLIMTLPDSTAVLPGHGPDTTVGTEREQNPYL